MSEMSKLFISYRRDDSADVTGRLHDRLNSHFGEGTIFLDTDNIPFGMDFRTCIGDAVNQCDVLLAVIGDRWLDANYADGPEQGSRRLDDPRDFVRIEIEAALTRGIPGARFGRQRSDARPCPFAGWIERACLPQRRRGPLGALFSSTGRPAYPVAGTVSNKEVRATGRRREGDPYCERRPPNGPSPCPQGA